MGDRVYFIGAWGVFGANGLLRHCVIFGLIETVVVALADWKCLMLCSIVIRFAWVKMEQRNRSGTLIYCCLCLMWAGMVIAYSLWQWKEWKQIIKVKYSLERGGD